MTCAALRTSLKKHGESAILRRVGVPDTDVNLKAFVRQNKPSDLVGDVDQGLLCVIIGNEEISAANWPLPIKKSDKIVIRGKVYAIQMAESVLDGAKIVRHNLTVKG